MRLFSRVSRLDSIHPALRPGPRTFPPFVLFLMVLLSGRVQAQATPELELGSRMRVQSDAGRSIVGILVARSADTLFLQPSWEPVPLPVATRSITLAEVSLGQPDLSSILMRRGMEGAAIGAVGWAGMDLLIEKRITSAVLLGAGLGAVTFIFDALIGPRRERWRAVEIHVSPP
ncbi:MAG TPA: hypothetical protein VGB66_18220 [Longimicrobium sp.]|jgi:hypothetical protein